MHPPAPDWVAVVERSAPEEQWAMLCLLAGRAVELDDSEFNGAIRRAELLLATQGDPRRPPELHGRAAAAVAADLDTPERRAALEAGLERLTPLLAGSDRAAAALDALLGDPELAWQAYALAVLAEALGDADDG